MSNRVSIYGRSGERQTELIRREMRSMSLSYDFYDIAKQPQFIERIIEAGATEPDFPKVQISCGGDDGSVILTKPDVNTLRQMLYAQDVLGVTSYWV